MEDIEIWKNIEEFEGYQISSFGRVKTLERNIFYSGINCYRLRKEKILKSWKNKIDGYFYVSLYKNKNVCKKTIHNLVAMYFLGYKTNENFVIDHRDNNKTNNHVINLQYISIRENNSKDRKNASSKYTGVCWHKLKNMWISSIKINGKTKHLGYFDDEIEASEAYKKELKSLLNY